MLKKTITYEDFLGNKRTEDFRFNLTEAELMGMQWGVSGGYQAYIERIVQTEDMPKLMDMFKDLIDICYGVMTDDGKGFVKRPEDLESFKSTNAYSQLFMELATNDEAAAAFINGVIPNKLSDELQKEMTKKNLAKLPE